MNDRFKFRFWRKDCDGKSTPEYADLMSIDGSAEPYDNGEGGAYCYCPDETICEQCTGLRDKNGKLIYEGDILNSLYRKDGCIGLYVVEWFDGNLGVKKVGEHQQKMVSVSLLDLTRCEVIGNIHENEEFKE